MLTRTEAIGLIKLASLQKRALWDKALDAVDSAMQSGQHERAYNLVNRMMGRVAGAKSAYSDIAYGTSDLPGVTARIGNAAKRMSSYLVGKESLLNGLADTIWQTPSFNADKAIPALKERTADIFHNVTNSNIAKHITKNVVKGVGSITNLLRRNR